MRNVTIWKLLAIKRYPSYARRLLGLSYPGIVKLMGVTVKGNVSFQGLPIVSMIDQSSISIDEGCNLVSRSDMTDLGVNHPLILRTLRPNAKITIGKNTGISGGSICAAIRVDIGSECLIGANVTITDTDFHPIAPAGRFYNENPQDIAAAPVVIEDNVFIGTGSIILKGVRIGENSVIGAGSIVTKSIPKNTIAAGNPARVLREIDIL